MHAATRLPLGSFTALTSCYYFEIVTIFQYIVAQVGQIYWALLESFGVSGWRIVAPIAKCLISSADHPSFSFQYEKEKKKTKGEEKPVPKKKNLVYSIAL